MHELIEQMEAVDILQDRIDTLVDQYISTQSLISEERILKEIYELKKEKSKLIDLINEH